MPDELSLPPDTATAYRRSVNVWASMFNRTIDNQEHAPNYSRWIANIVAGLMQAKPPEATGLPDDDDTDLSELVEEVARVSASMGVAYLRPVFDGAEWTTQVLGPSNVVAYWNHRRLSSALIWVIVDDPTHQKSDAKRLAIVERWGDDGRVTLEVWRGDYNAQTGAFTGNKMLPLGSLPTAIEELPAVQGILADIETAGDTLRYLYPVVWQWQSGYPAPIHAGNEHVVQGLERLWDQEQVDAEMARNRIAIDTKMLTTSPILEPGGGIIAPAGFGLRDNVIALSSAPGGAQGIDKQLPFHVISFPDSLTQRERIERRENALLECCGINPQSVGRSVAGRSDSAAAKRADQQMTLQTVATPARKMTRGLSDALTQSNVLNGGTGDVTVTVYEGVRPIASESYEDTRVLASTDAASTETLVRTAHPTWTDPQVADELARIAAEGRGAIVPADTDNADPFGDLPVLDFT